MRSLSSLIDACRILKDTYHINSEIVIIDNFSQDGTFEAIAEVKHLEKDIPIKLVQYRCKRGLGRSIALGLSNGAHLVYVDMDVVYDTELIARLISSYTQNPLFSSNALYIALVPKALALDVGSFQNLNRTEDVEFCARLTEKNMVLPLMDPTTYKFYDNVSELEKDHGKMHQYSNPSSKIFVETYASERRYARGFSGYLKRELNNKIDMICGLGLSPTKVIRELWFLRRIRGVIFLISVYYHIGFWLLTKLMRKEIFSHSTSLSNNVLSDCVMIVNYVKSLSRATRLGLIEREYADRLIHTVFASEKMRSVLPYAHALGFEP